jgi:acetyl/propionyl-CoA carboxylase alpha subunit
VGYEGAGTVEFLIAGDEYYFLEMNTRLQVEHGVTELVTGLDLVQLQLRVAAGEPLPFSQEELAVSGHAIEARVCAEVPTEDCRPAPGPVLHARWPSGAGIRVDAGVETGSVVSAAYDSLVAKVMAHGHDRPAALARLGRALSWLELDGLDTNRSLLEATLAEPGFGRGDVSIEYLAQHPEVVAARLDDAVRARHAAAVALHLESVRAAGARVQGVPASWRNVGAAHHVDALADGAGVLEAWVERRRGVTTVAVEPTGLRLGGRADGAGTVELEEHGVMTPYRVRWHGTVVCVNGPEGQSSFTMHVEGEDESGLAAAGECRAPLPGGVTKVLVAAGQAVAEGTPLVVLEAMKMEHTLRAAGAGVVAEVRVTEGQQVDVGELLVRVESKVAEAL